MKTLVLILSFVTLTTLGFAQEEGSCEDPSMLPPEISKLSPVEVHVVLAPSSEAVLSQKISKHSFYRV